MLRLGIPLIVLSLLAGCDSNPDPSFKQSAEDRAAAEVDDPYSPLSSPPQLHAYSNAEPGQRASIAESSAATLAGTMQTMLDKMVADKKLAKNVPLEKQCRPAIDASMAFQSSSGKDEALNRAVDLYSALTQCRDDAIKQGEAGGNGAARAKLLRRFASNGMALVGMSLIAKGDAENGLKFWREGDALIVRDKPGFEFGIESLRGY